MKTSGGMAEPVIKALIYGVVAGVIVFLWGVIGLGGRLGVFGAGIGVMVTDLDVIGALIGLIYRCCSYSYYLLNLQGEYRFRS